MKYLALGLVGLFSFVCSPVPEAHAVVACRAGYYWHGGACVVVRPVARCYWRAGIRICR